MNGNGRNGFLMKVQDFHGTKKDFIVANIARLIMVFLSGLTLWQAKDIYDAVKDFKDNAKPLRTEMKSMSNRLETIEKNAVTKEELSNAEARVRNQIAEQLKHQPILTGNDHGQNYEK